MSTAENFSPEQLFITGSFCGAFSTWAAQDTTGHGVTNLDTFGTGVDDDPDAPIPVEQSDYNVLVPDPLQDDGRDGINQFNACVHAITQLQQEERLQQEITN